MTPLPAPLLRPDRSFERLYRRHAADVYRYALAMLRNPSDAEDVTQTTFLNAYRVYRRGERPRVARNWLIAIAHNACRQRIRELRRRSGEVSFDESSAVGLARDDDPPRAEGLRRALGHLAFNQRSALVMRELEGRSYREIGQILGVSTSAVETLIFRARRALREQLEGSLTCTQAELAISRQLDRRLPGAEKRFLRAHLRECADCSALARRQRARRAALRGMTAIPLPSSLASFFGGGSATGGGLAVKAAAVLAAGAAVGGGTYEAVERAPWRASEDVAGAALSRVSPPSGVDHRPEAARARLAASTAAAVPLSAASVRVPTTAGARRAVTRTPARAAARTSARAAARPAVIESSTPPAREEPRVEPTKEARAHGAKAKKPRRHANGHARPVRPTHSRPARAKPIAKATPKPQKTKAAKVQPVTKPEPTPAATSGEPPPAPNVPPGQAKKDDAPAVEAPLPQPSEAVEEAGSGASDEAHGQSAKEP